MYLVTKLQRTVKFFEMEFFTLQQRDLLPDHYKLVAWLSKALENENKIILYGLVCRHILYSPVNNSSLYCASSVKSSVCVIRKLPLLLAAKPSRKISLASAMRGSSS